ncbi:MAG: DNA polymerase III subunit gamma/tau [Rhodospirillales bacterium]|nr:DNA polymerase III subunit gamma/tau [Rhodospirillales bacterium]
MTEDQVPDPSTEQQESTGDSLYDGVPPPNGAAPGGDYRVLARKYRPTTFTALIGQEAMVQTLTNAIRSGRLAHAFILTGVRGVGKTTTARIIARGLNCIGPSATGGPTPEPCGKCEHCRAISEDRHVDVLEMDAASHTGVDDIRELIEGMRYRPTSARYKVYIIDEVHMLSKNAFNALLKTLEEPPEHVKFIFATTEVRKVPVTVLSRCQRFDLRRIDIDTLARHFAAVAKEEGAGITEAAVHLISRAADGSVRDGLSLLDQAIADSGEPEIGEEAVRRLLGLADRTVTFDMFDAVMRGDVTAALDLMAEQYRSGADPAVMLIDMLKLTHWLTRLKVVADAADAPGVPEAERVRGREMAAKLSMAALTRAWQMLLKGLDEVRSAPAPLLAAEMVVVRLAYVAELPTPAEAIKALGQPVPDTPAPKPPAVSTATAPSAPAAADVPTGGGEPPQAALAAVEMAPEAPPEPRLAAQPGDETPPPDPQSFADVVTLAAERKKAILHANLINNVHLVRFEPERVEFRPGEHAPPDLANQLSTFLNTVTDRRWVVTVSREAGAQTLREQEADGKSHAKAAAAKHPVVKAILDTFPGATIADVRGVETPAAKAPADGGNGGDES